MLENGIIERFNSTCINSIEVFKKVIRELSLALILTINIKKYTIIPQYEAPMST